MFGGAALARGLLRPGGRDTRGKLFDRDARIPSTVHWPGTKQRQPKGNIKGAAPGPE